MKKILMPTDLTSHSLRPIHEIVKQAGADLPEIYVVHFLSMPTSIAGLLFINRERPYHLIPPAFLEAFQLIRHKYLHMAYQIRFDFVYCNSPKYFRNYLDSQQFDAIHMLDDYRYMEPLEASENVHSFLDKVRIPVYRQTLNTVRYRGNPGFTLITH